MIAAIEKIKIVNQKQTGNYLDKYDKLYVKEIVRANQPMIVNRLLWCTEHLNYYGKIRSGWLETKKCKGNKSKSSSSSSAKYNAEKRKHKQQT